MASGKTKRKTKTFGFSVAFCIGGDSVHFSVCFVFAHIFPPNFRFRRRRRRIDGISSHMHSIRTIPSAANTKCGIVARSIVHRIPDEWTIVTRWQCFVWHKSGGFCENGVHVQRHIDQNSVSGVWRASRLHQIGCQGIIGGIQSNSWRYMWLLLLCHCRRALTVDRWYIPICFLFYSFLVVVHRKNSKSSLLDHHWNGCVQRIGARAIWKNYTVFDWLR